VAELRHLYGRKEHHPKGRACRLRHGLLLLVTRHRNRQHMNELPRHFDSPASCTPSRLKLFIFHDLQATPRFSDRLDQVRPVPAGLVDQRGKTALRFLRGKGVPFGVPDILGPAREASGSG